MNDRFQPTEPGLERVRQSRGLSWRVAAFTAVAVLAGIVGLKVVERTPAPPPAVAVAPSRGPDRSVLPSTTPPATPLTQPAVRPTRYPEIEPPQSTVSELTFGQDAFALVAQIGGRQYIGILREVEPGSFTGIFRLQIPSGAQGPYRFNFVQLWTRDTRVRNYVEIGSWDVSLDVLKEGTLD